MPPHANNAHFLVHVCVHLGCGGFPCAYALTHSSISGSVIAFDTSEKKINNFLRKRKLKLPRIGNAAMKLTLLNEFPNDRVSLRRLGNFPRFDLDRLSIFGELQQTLTKRTYHFCHWMSPLSTDRPDFWFLVEFNYNKCEQYFICNIYSDKYGIYKGSLSLWWIKIYIFSDLGGSIVSFYSGWILLASNL